MLAMEALAEKDLPCSKVRKKRMGPEVRGKPTSSPEMLAPHLRSAIKTKPISMGARVSFSRIMTL